MAFVDFSPERLNPDQRRQRIAAIFAQGLQRLRALDLALRESQPVESDPAANPLDVCAQTRVTVGRDSGRAARA
jgi:hypothetical protein